MNTDNVYSSPLAAWQSGQRKLFQVIDADENTVATYRNEVLAERHAKAEGLTVRSFLIG